MCENIFITIQNLEEYLIQACFRNDGVNSFSPNTVQIHYTTYMY